MASRCQTSRSATLGEHSDLAQVSPDTQSLLGRAWHARCPDPRLLRGGKAAPLWYLAVLPSAPLLRALAPTRHPLWRLLLDLSSLLPTAALHGPRSYSKNTETDSTPKTTVGTPAYVAPEVLTRGTVGASFPAAASACRSCPHGWARRPCRGAAPALQLSGSWVLPVLVETAAVAGAAWKAAGTHTTFQGAGSTTPPLPHPTPHPPTHPRNEQKQKNKALHPAAPLSLPAVRRRKGGCVVLWSGAVHDAGGRLPVPGPS